MTQPLILLAVLRVARITIGARIYCKFFVGQLPLTLPSVRPSQGYDYRADSSIRRQTMLCTVTKGIDLEANDLGCGKLRCLAGPGDVIQRRAINMTRFGHLFGYVAGTEIGGGGGDKALERVFTIRTRTQTKGRMRTQMRNAATRKPGSEISASHQGVAASLADHGISQFPFR